MKNCYRLRMYYYAYWFLLYMVIILIEHLERLRRILSSIWKMMQARF